MLRKTYSKTITAKTEGKTKEQGINKTPGTEQKCMSSSLKSKMLTCVK